MKKTSIIILLAIGTLKLQSQEEVIDVVEFRISYIFSCKTAPLQSEYPKTDLMYLDIGENVSKFYSRYEQIRDSIQFERLNNKLSINKINRLKNTYTRGAPRIYYHLFQDNKFIGTDRFVFLYALYGEKRPHNISEENGMYISLHKSPSTWDLGNYGDCRV